MKNLIVLLSCLIFAGYNLTSKAQTIPTTPVEFGSGLNSNSVVQIVEDHTYDVDSNTLQIVSGVVVSVRSKGGIDSLAHANVINVTNFGAIPYIPPNFATTDWLTNAVDCSAAISNALAYASNQPAPRVVYFPSGFYKITNSLVNPPITSWKGEGILHIGSFGTTRTLSASGTVATNNYSVIWWAGDTNETAVKVPYNNMGRLSIEDIEFCGATNAMMDLGQGFGANTIETIPDEKMGWCGIDFDTGQYCGGFRLRNVSICGFRVGVNHAGNDVIYDGVQFNGNNIGFLCTNVWAPDQVLFRNCSIGNRDRGVGYIIAHGHGWIMENPCDIEYFTHSILFGADLTVIGGNSEAGSTNQPLWTIGQTGFTTWAIVNTWPYTNYTKSFFTGGYQQSDTASSELTIFGGHWRDTASIMDSLVADRSAQGGAQGIHLTVIGSTWSTTNTYAGKNVLLQTEGTATPSPTYANGPGSGVSAIVEQWHGFSAPTLNRRTYAVGRGGMAVDPNYDILYQGAIAGSIQSATTNLSIDRYTILNYQQGNATTPGWFQAVVGTNVSSTTGLPGLAMTRLLMTDPAPPTPNGQPTTNITTLHDVGIKHNLSVSNQINIGITNQINDNDGFAGLKFWATANNGYNAFIVGQPTGGATAGIYAQGGGGVVVLKGEATGFQFRNLADNAIWAYLDGSTFRMAGNIQADATTNILVFGGTNLPPATTATPAKWISVQISGETNRYRMPLYE